MIENKIDSVAHSNQLARYYQIVQEEYPETRFIGVYLTPSGEPPPPEELPEDGEYVPIGYAVIRDLVDQMAQTTATPPDAELRMVLQHYSEMLRRHIVTDPKIVALCRELYQKHRRAFDLVFEHKLDHRSAWREHVLDLIRKTPTLRIAECWETQLRFVPPAWDVELLKDETVRRNERRVLFFEARIEHTGISLKLYIGHGPPALREKIFAMASKGGPFQPRKKLSADWTKIWGRPLATGLSPEESDDVLIARLTKQWQLFRDKDLPAIQAKVAEAGILGG